MRSVSERVKVANKIVNMTMDDGHKTKEAHWLMISADDCGIDIDDELMKEIMKDKTSSAKQASQLKSLRSDLLLLMDQPLVVDRRKIFDVQQKQREMEQESTKTAQSDLEQRHNNKNNNKKKKTSSDSNSNSTRQKRRRRK